MNNVFGYARVSTHKQKTARQVENIRKAFPTAIVFEEAYTGTTTSRPVWNKLLKQVKSGDTIVFDEVSRMSRNADDGYKLYQELYNNGIELVFIKEPTINTSVYRSTMQVAMSGNKYADVYLEATNKLLWLIAEEQIRIAFNKAQSEVDFLHERVREGMAKSGAPDKIRQARKGKTYETKKARECKAKIIKLSKDFKGVMTDKEAMEMLMISRNSYYKYKRELIDEQIQEHTKDN